MTTQFPKLQKIEARYPNLATVVDKVARYIRGRVELGLSDVAPQLLASFLGWSEAEALAILMLFEKEGLLEPIYKIYCHANGTLLKRVKNKNEIPDSIYCKFCDADHNDPDMFDIELEFEIPAAQWDPAGHNVLA